MTPVDIHTSVSRHWFQISDCLSGRFRILNLGSGAGPDIPTDIDHKDLIGHINFPLVHVIQHFLGALGPDLLIARVAEEANAETMLPSNVKRFYTSMNASLKRVLPQRVMTLYLPTIAQSTLAIAKLTLNERYSHMPHRPFL